MCVCVCEASLLKRLKHANIVLLHDIIHSRDSLTLVFEYVVSSSRQWLCGHVTKLGVGCGYLMLLFPLTSVSPPLSTPAADGPGPVHDAAPRRAALTQRAGGSLQISLAYR